MGATVAGVILVIALAGAIALGAALIRWLVGLA